MPSRYHRVGRSEVDICLHDIIVSADLWWIYRFTISSCGPISGRYIGSRYHCVGRSQVDIWVHDTIVWADLRRILLRGPI
jgi:hypothetical protein